MKFDCYSRDGETFTDGDLADAIHEYEPEVGQVIHLGVKDPVTSDQLISEDDIIETLGDRAWGEVSECAEGYPDVTTEARAEMREFLEQWVNKHCPPTFYRVKNTVEHTVTAEEIAAAMEG